MVTANVAFSNEVFQKIWNKNNLSYEDIINYYEKSSFDYEKVNQKASDFKDYLISELKK